MNGIRQCGAQVARRRRSRSCLPCGCRAAPGRAGARAPAGSRRRRCRRRSPRSRPATGRRSAWPAPAGRRRRPGSFPCCVTSASPPLRRRRRGAVDVVMPDRLRPSRSGAPGRRSAALRATVATHVLAVLLDREAARCAAAAARAPGRGPTRRPGCAPELKPAGSRAAVARSRSRTPAALGVERADDAASPAPVGRLCLIALVSSSLSVSAIGIASASGSVQSAAPAPPTPPVGCVGRRCAAPSR